MYAILSSGTGGWLTKCSEPIRPDSSAVNATKTIERRWRPSCPCAKCSASSSIARGAGGVVVGAVVDLGGVGLEAARAAVAEVVVVGADDDVLAGQLALAGQHADDVLHRACPCAGSSPARRP